MLPHQPHPGGTIRVRVSTAFNRLLQIPGAWVTDVTIAEGDVEVGLRPKARLLYCPCGIVSSAVYDRRRRRWRHLDLGRCRLWLVYQIRRVECPECGVRTEELPWARPGARVDWWVIGRAPVPACTVRDLAAAGARLKPLVIPSTMPEAGYRPSAALAEFVRGRDLTSRFPGCDQPAEVCDIDHTVPYPIGPTHPSNLKLYCRAHHQANTRGIARLLLGWSGLDPVWWTHGQAACAV